MPGRDTIPFSTEAMRAAARDELVCVVDHQALKPNQLGDTCEVAVFQIGVGIE